jgi:glucosamine--fructose-6-phosphate aminotransferase (isomerizing)
MNLTNEKYSKYALVKEMMETSDVVKNMDFKTIDSFSSTSKKVLLTGEGSSRIFPGKRMLEESLQKAYQQTIVVESAMQASEYNLGGYQMFVASNSGKTAECVILLNSVAEKNGSKGVTGIIGGDKTPIAQKSDQFYVLTCGKEEAVAATKSVIEQALVYDIFFRKLNNQPVIDYTSLADAINSVLTMEISSEIIDTITNAPVVYFAGRNNGVAEELTLKTNEITRKKSDFLEGTYAVHGIEEVMDSDEVVLVIDPFKEEEEKFREVLEKGVGLSVFAVSSRDTSFPTIKIPDLGELNPYLQLVAGWNILIEVGISLGVDLDKPARARKIGNEFQG